MCAPRSALRFSAASRRFPGCCSSGNSSGFVRTFRPAAGSVRVNSLLWDFFPRRARTLSRYRSTRDDCIYDQCDTKHHAGKATVRPKVATPKRTVTEPGQCRD
jgi:hypothetical protein